jgi:hypothetical protein
MESVNYGTESVNYGTESVLLRKDLLQVSE